MTNNRKGRTGWHQATLKTSKHTRNFTGLAARIKEVIVTLALWGWFPLGLARWINSKGGPSDE